MSIDDRQQALIDWLQAHQYTAPELNSASADASARRYFRFQHQNKSLIAVDTPLPVQENQAFIDLQAALRQAGLNTPSIYQADTVKGWMVIEDFGSVTFADALATSDAELALYKKATTLIGELQRSDELQTLSHSLPKYTAEMIERELSFFPQWCLQSHLGIKLDAQDDKAWQQLCKSLTQAFTEQPQGFVHRDFHSRNLMHLESELGLIDFQGAVRGPLTYDWVSLLRDCYMEMPPAQLQELLIGCYEQLPQLAKQHSLKEVHRWFNLTGLQRHLKAIGIFCRLKIQDNKERYMADVPRTFRYVQAVANQYEELSPFAELIEKHRLAERLC